MANQKGQRIKAPEGEENLEEPNPITAPDFEANHVDGQMIKAFVIEEIEIRFFAGDPKRGDIAEEIAIDIDV
jgi:hypothetical protein